MLTPDDWRKIEAAAQKMGFPHAARKWREREQIPAERVPVLAKLTRIAKARLRPDLFGAA